MHTVYNLEYKVLDKMGRVKKTLHVGVFGDLDKLESAKNEVITINPGVVFDVHSIDYIFEPTE
jgi:hypothetical protein